MLTIVQRSIPRDQLGLLDSFCDALEICVEIYQDPQCSLMVSEPDCIFGARYRQDGKAFHTLLFNGKTLEPISIQYRNLYDLPDPLLMKIVTTLSQLGEDPTMFMNTSKTLRERLFKYGAKQQALKRIGTFEMLHFFDRALDFSVFAVVDTDNLQALLERSEQQVHALEAKKSPAFLKNKDLVSSTKIINELKKRLSIHAQNPIFLASLLQLMYEVISRTSNRSQGDCRYMYANEIDSQYKQFPRIADLAYKAGVLSALVMNGIVREIFKPRLEAFRANKRKIDSYIECQNNISEAFKQELLALLCAQGVIDVSFSQYRACPSLMSFFNKLCKGFVQGNKNSATFKFVLKPELVDDLNDLMTDAVLSDNAISLLYKSIGGYNARERSLYLRRHNPFLGSRSKKRPASDLDGTTASALHPLKRARSDLNLFDSSLRFRGLFALLNAHLEPHFDDKKLDNLLEDFTELTAKIVTSPSLSDLLQLSQTLNKIPNILYNQKLEKKDQVSDERILKKLIYMIDEIIFHYQSSLRIKYRHRLFGDNRVASASAQLPQAHPDDQVSSAERPG